MVLKIFKLLIPVILPLILAPLVAIAKKETVVILYQQTTLESQSIYEEIIKGISKNTPFNQKVFKISDKNHAEIKKWILETKQPPAKAGGCLVLQLWIH